MSSLLHNKRFDAVAKSGDAVEIKTTQGQSVAFRSEPHHAIVIRILGDGSLEEIYNGPGSLAWSEFEGKKLPTNGQFQISLSKLKALGEKIDHAQRISRCR